MEQLSKKTNSFRMSLFIYLSIIIISLIANYFLLFITGDFISHVAIYLSDYVKIVKIEPFIIFSGKVLAELLLLNIFILMAIEFVIVYLFHINLNNLFRLSKLFTIKKYIILEIIIVSIQIAISIWLWNK